MKYVALGSIVIIIMALSGCQTLKYDAYNQAVDADKVGDYSKAAQLYQSAADSNDLELRQSAQFRLAQMHLDGVGVKRDPQTALRLYKLAANGPDQSWRNLANFELGTLYQNGVPDHIEIDRSAAATHYKKSAEEGSKSAAQFYEWISEYPDVYVSLYESEFRHQGSEQAPAGMTVAYNLFNAGNHKEAFPIFLWHAKNGNAEAQTAVAVFFKDGLSIASDFKRYTAWVYLAARNGNSGAQLELGLLYGRSELLPANDAEAEKWFRAAAEQGEIEAINWLGVLFLHPIDEGREPNAPAAVRFFHQAAEAGSGHAMTNLGDVYLAGVGVEKNRETAKNYYLVGAAAGNLLARRRLFEEFNLVFDPNSEETVKEIAALPRPKSQAASPALLEVGKRREKPTSVELYAKLAPSVMRLYALNVVDKTDAVSQGSAVAVTDNLAITNCHVIENKDAYAARLRGKVTLFKYVSGDHERDLCIIRADAQLIPVEATRRYGDLKVGEKVYAIGSPKGLENTLSEGIVSGLRNSEDTRYIQTTAPFTYGSSGGGLFDDEGRLIGVTTGVLDSGSLNFAVAVDEALELFTDLR